MFGGPYLAAELSAGNLHTLYALQYSDVVAE